MPTPSTPVTWSKVLSTSPSVPKIDCENQIPSYIQNLATLKAMKEWRKWKMEGSQCLTMSVPRGGRRWWCHWKCREVSGHLDSRGKFPCILVSLKNWVAGKTGWKFHAEIWWGSLSGTGGGSLSVLPIPPGAPWRRESLISTSSQLALYSAHLLPAPRLSQIVHLFRGQTLSQIVTKHSVLWLGSLHSAWWIWANGCRDA